jgi:hypothetical protein
MTVRKNLLAIVFSVVVLATVPAYAQQFPGRGDDVTTSLGSFKIQVANQFAPLFNGCPGYDANTQILKSPTMFDGHTVVGRSDVITDGDANDQAGVPVGTAGTTVAENMLFPPPGFPCAGVSGCTSGAGTREVHTEVRSLKLASGPVAVRAGIWYNNAAPTSSPPARISPGEVESHSGPGGAAANDFPASSFFDVFVKVDVPACGTGGFPGATLYNSSPLLVKNFQLTQFPPRVVYLHDSSTIVPILFLTANAPLWNADDILGYFVLAGHGVGFTNSQADQDEFNNFMTCSENNSPSNSKGFVLSTDCAIVKNPPPSPSPSPTPSPIPSPSPRPVADAKTQR